MSTGSVKIVDGLIVNMVELLTEKVLMTKLSKNPDFFRRRADGKSISAQEYQNSHANENFCSIRKNLQSPRLSYISTCSVSTYDPTKIRSKAARENLDFLGSVPQDLCVSNKSSYSSYTYPVAVDGYAEKIGQRNFSKFIFLPEGYPLSHLISYTGNVVNTYTFTRLIPHVSGVSVFDNLTAIKSQEIIRDVEDLSYGFSDNPKQTYTACAMIIALNELGNYVKTSPDTSLLDMLKDESFAKKVRQRCQRLHFEVYPHSFSLLYALTSSLLVSNVTKLKTVKVRNAMAHITANGIANLSNTAQALKDNLGSRGIVDANRVQTISEKLDSVGAYLVSAAFSKEVDDVDTLSQWAHIANGTQQPQTREMATRDNLEYLFAMSETRALFEISSARADINGGRETFMNARKFNCAERVAAGSKAQKDDLIKVVNTIGVDVFTMSAPMSALWALSCFTTKNGGRREKSYDVSTAIDIAQALTASVENKENNSREMLKVFTQIVQNFSKVSTETDRLKTPEVAQAYANGMSVDMIFDMAGFVRQDDSHHRLNKTIDNLISHGL